MIPSLLRFPAFPLLPPEVLSLRPPCRADKGTLAGSAHDSGKPSALQAPLRCLLPSGLTCHVFFPRFVGVCPCVCLPGVFWRPSLLTSNSTHARYSFFHIPPFSPLFRSCLNAPPFLHRMKQVLPVSKVRDRSMASGRGSPFSITISLPRNLPSAVGHPRS